VHKYATFYQSIDIIMGYSTSNILSRQDNYKVTLSQDKHSALKGCLDCRSWLV